MSGVPPGGATDIVGRMVAAKMQEVWGQPVVVENRPGAGTVVGTDAVAKSAPDGYTLAMVVTAHVINPSLRSSMPYDTVKDLAAVTQVAVQHLVMAMNPEVEAKSVADLVALAKKQPGKIPYASSGAGGQQHLAMESVRSMAGIDVVHVPYKGFGQGVTDVLANQVPLIFGGITASISYVGGGKLKALGVTSARRAKAMPDVPAIAETLPSFDITAWYGFIGPANLPRDIVNKINADSRAIIARPDFLERLAKDGIEPVGNTPEAFAAQIKTDIDRWAHIVKAANIKPE